MESGYIDKRTGRPAIYRKVCFVNVTIENLAPCKKLLRVEIDSKDVDAAFESMIKDFQRQASLPGFRPGKAPRDVVAKRYEKDIQQEVKKKLIPDAYRKAVDEQKLDVVGYPDIEEIQFGRGQALQFAGHGRNRAGLSASRIQRAARKARNHRGHRR